MVSDLFSRKLEYRDTIVFMKADIDLSQDEFFYPVFEQVIYTRKLLENFIEKYPEFYASYESIGDDALEHRGCKVPAIALDMARASRLCGVGPMASVAGAFSDMIAKKIYELGAGCAIVENGGDVAMFGEREFSLQIKTGNCIPGSNSISGKLYISINPCKENPGSGMMGVCTSSASGGHSISLGKSDAVTVIAKDPLLADAAATAVGNAAKGEGAGEPVKRGLEKFNEIKNNGADLEAVIITGGGYTGEINMKKYLGFISGN